MLRVQLQAVLWRDHVKRSTIMAVKKVVIALRKLELPLRNVMTVSKIQNLCLPPISLCDCKCDDGIFPFFSFRFFVLSTFRISRFDCCNQFLFPFDLSSGTSALVLLSSFENEVDLRFLKTIILVENSQNSLFSEKTVLTNGSFWFGGSKFEISFSE